MKTSGLVLFACAGMLLSGGAILGGSTSWSLLRMSYYFWTTDLGVELGSSVIVMAGALLCLPTCWLASVVPYHKKYTSLTVTLISLAMASMLMLSLGVSSATTLSHALRDPAALNASLLRALTHVNYDPAVRSSFSAMQIELKCCGVQSPNDWLAYRSSLPPSCCGRMWNGKRTDNCHSSIYNTGCLRPALCELRNFINAITVLASALIIVMAVTLFASAYALVLEVLERVEPATKAQEMRVACLPFPSHFVPASNLLTPLAPPQTPPPTLLQV